MMVKGGSRVFDPRDFQVTYGATIVLNYISQSPPIFFRNVERFVEHSSDSWFLEKTDSKAAFDSSAFQNTRQ